MTFACYNRWYNYKNSYWGCNIGGKLGIWSVNVIKCLNNLAGMHIQINIKRGVLLVTVMWYTQSVTLVWQIRYWAIDKAKEIDKEKVTLFYFVYDFHSRIFTIWNISLLHIIVRCDFFFLYLLYNIICVEEREKLENNVFQSLQKPLVTTKYALTLSLSHFKSHFHNLWSKMPLWGTVSWEVMFKVAVTMVTKENKICFLNIHTGYKIIRLFMYATRWSDFWTLKCFFVPTKADILQMAFSYKIFKMALIIPVGSVLGLDFFKSQPPFFPFPIFCL